MAGVKMSTKTRKYVLSKGFFLIELSGDTIHIAVPGDFTPKTW
jgi:hypothetical protein